MSRFLISNLRGGPAELRRQLPISGETVDIRMGPDGLTYFSARLDHQVVHHLDPNTDTAALPAEHLGVDEAGPFVRVSDIVMRASRPGEAPHYGMQRFPVDLAYVLDPSYRDDQTVDFAKLLPIAAADIDDLPEDATAPTPQQGQPLPVAQPDPSDAGGGQDRPAEPESDTGDEDSPPPGSTDDLTGDLTAPVVTEYPPDNDPTAEEIATPADPRPVPTETADQPETVTHQDDPAPSAAPEGAEDADEAEHTETVPVRASSIPIAAGDDEQPPAAAPRDVEVTRPVRTATTARPPAPLAPAQRPRQPPAPPQGRPVHNHPFAGAPAAAPPRPLHHSGPPLASAPWPPDARPPRPVPARQPEPPRPFTPPPPIIPTTPRRRAPSARAVMVAAAIIAAVVLVAVAVWNVAGSRSDSNHATPTTTQPRPSDADVQRLKKALPKGYSDSSCTTDDGAAEASLDCGPNADAGGPRTASYTLYPNQQALTQAFTDTIATFNRVTCPGNIQSPGPWRRNAAPNKVAGTLFCGTRAGEATVVWTSDAQSLLNVAEAGAQGPSLDQLYAWWATHS